MEPSGESRPSQLIVLSAKTSTALDRTCANLARHLEQHPDIHLADVAYTLGSGRKRFNYRRVLVCRTVDDATLSLRTLNPERVRFSRNRRTGPWSSCFPDRVRST